MKKKNFSEKMNSFLENKKKREENLSSVEEKKKKKFDKSNFTERRNDELAKNAVHVIAGGGGIHRTDYTKQVMRCVEAHAEGRSGATPQGENKCDEQYSQANGRETQQKGSSNRYNYTNNVVTIERNSHTEPTVGKESEESYVGRTNELSLHNAINHPMEKMKKLRIKTTHRYLSKAEDASYRLVKDYHREVDKCIEEIKSETFLKANLLKSEMESILTQVERLTQEALDLKWDGDPPPRGENSQGEMKRYHSYVTRYTHLMESKLCEKFIPTNGEAVEALPMNDPPSMKDHSENIKKKCILNEIKKEVDRRGEDIKEKWECVQNLFTKLNEKIKNFISHFERKHEMATNKLSDNTQRMESQMKEKIFYSTEEASQLVGTEMERAKQFFLDFLTHFNDYVTETYNYVYQKYHRCECVFRRDILRQQSYRDVCCVYATISKNYLHGLPADKVFNRLMATLEGNYNAVYARRVGLPPDQFFAGFLAAPQGGGAAYGEAADGDAVDGDAVDSNAAKLHQRHCADVYQRQNQHYEEYLQRYEEIKAEVVRYREVVLHTFFHLDNFAAATAAETTATAGGRPLLREAPKKAPPKWRKKEKGAGKENLPPKWNAQGEVKREDRPEGEPSKGKHPKEGNHREGSHREGSHREGSHREDDPMEGNPMQGNHMEDDPNGAAQKNDEHSHETILAQICKHKSAFIKCTENILANYNLMNLRDDYFILSFFSILETLKSEILMMSSHVESEMKASIHQCCERNRLFLCHFDTLLREYNSVVRRCLKCKDHLVMLKLIADKEEAKKKLESCASRGEEEARTTNETLVAQSKRLWGDFFFAALSKAKVIGAEGEAPSARRANERSGTNDTPGEGKHTHLKGQQKTTPDENEKNIIRQLVGPKHTYMYDEDTIWQHTYISYRSNMMGLLHPGRDVGAYLQRSVKGKARPAKQTGKKASHEAHKKESTIRSNIAQIRREYIQQKGEANRGSHPNEEVNPGGTHSGETTYSLPQITTKSLPDELLYNEDLLKKLFQSFTSSYYERFKETLFEHLLKAKMKSERECTKWCQQMGVDSFEEQLRRDDEKIKEVAVKLEEKFKTNKEAFENASQKLSLLVREYEQVTKEDWGDYQKFKDAIRQVEHTLDGGGSGGGNGSGNGSGSGNGNDNDCDDALPSRYAHLVETLKASFKSLREHLLRGEKKLREEIKRVETYSTMLIRTGQTNVDLGTIETVLCNSNHLLLSVRQKRQDVENAFNANVYIFNNKFRAISSRTVNRGTPSGTAPPPTDRQMIHYLIAKEEIKNNLLIFYLLVYQIRVCMGQSGGEGEESGGTPHPGERKAGQPAYTFRQSLKVERSPRGERAAKAAKAVKAASLVSAASPLSALLPVNAVNGAKFPNGASPQTPQDKFPRVQNCIYQIGTFRKIQKIYQLDLAREDSLVSNFFLSRLIGPQLPHLVFCKGTGMQESPDDCLTFGLFNNRGKEQPGEKGIDQLGKQPAAEGSSCETVPLEKCPPKADPGDEIETSASNTKPIVSSAERGTPSGGKVKRSGKGTSEGEKLTRMSKETDPQEGNRGKKGELHISNDHPPDASSYGENELFRKEYLDVKFFLYTCAYIIHLISNVIQTTPPKGPPKERQPTYSHSLFISYDLSHAIYKSNLLIDKIENKKVQMTDLVVNKKAMSPLVFCADHISRRTELIHLFKFEKETVAKLFERTFAQLRGLHFVSGNDTHVRKIHSEYADDLTTLATYLKALSKKAAYFTFRCIYKRHEALSTERINTMQKNLLQAFKELNERLKVTDTGESTASHVAKRKEAIKSLLHSYVAAIRGMLTSHLSYLHANLSNNAIFFVHLLSLLPAGPPSSGSGPHGGDPPPEKANGKGASNARAANAKGATNVAFLKIHHVDISADYDLSDIAKKIDKAYGPTGHQGQADSGAKRKAGAEVLYLPYSEENLYVAKKLENKMDKYRGKLYAHMAEALDGKKKEVIKLISSDVKEHRRYYE
ncbi:conserved Plasmodium protein, unknown function [Plasmodium vivax]|uniref:Uncharacterized protein n=1 Tax=Plasmodium vivax TaxID=5855 RepID=A0A1G4GTV1_PLAVI|nr:conserved Plasmodium protein, unknown function [Plasmodium vivax]